MYSFPTLVTLASLASLPLAQGASFIDNFDGLTPGIPGTPLTSYNGWTQSQANPGVPGVEPLAWGQTVGGSNGFGLGPAYGLPTGSSYSVSHAVSNALGGSSLQTTFVIVDSDSAFPSRNDYSIGLYSGAIRLFSLDMLAVSQTVPGTINDQWNIRWGTGTSTNSAAFGGVLEDGRYDLAVSFVPNGANIDFILTLTGASSISTTGTLAGLAGQNISEYRVGSNLGTASQWGDGLIGIDNVAVVPETSSALLAGLGALGLFRRRRN